MKNSIFSDQLCTAIDIGTTKICVLMVKHDSAGNMDIVGIGKSPSYGLKKGVVVDIAKTVQSIKQAVNEAQLMAGCQIESAYIGISGSHIQSCNSMGMVAIKNGQIRATDIAQAVAAARAVSIEQGQQILHALPQYFIIDSREKVFDPLDMYAIRLEALVHIITGSVASVHNLLKCCQMAGIEVCDIVLEQLASAQAVLTPDERQLGVAMLDIGGGTSDLAIYQNNNIRHTKVIPVAGNHVTNDIALGLHTTIAQAEQIKKEFGYASNSLLKDDQCIEILRIDGSGKYIIVQSELVTIIEARIKELLLLVQQEINKQQLRSAMPAGIVLTGGGSLLKGIEHVASEIFNMPVRIGNPCVDHAFAHVLQSPVYATGYGLLLHALKKQDNTSIQRLEGPLITRIFSRMKSWMSDFF